MRFAERIRSNILTAALVGLPATALAGTAAAAAPAVSDRRPAVSVLWFGENLGPDCPVDVEDVEREVRRIFQGMGVEVRWTTIVAGDAEYHDEVIVIPLQANPATHPLVMGSTNRGSRSAWVFCSVIERALRIRRPTRDAARLLSRAVGRVAAHEIVHVLVPAMAHAPEGLMAARWEEAGLRESGLAADRATGGAVRGQLSHVAVRHRPLSTTSRTSDVAAGGQ